MSASRRQAYAFERENRKTLKRSREREYPSILNNESQSLVLWRSMTRKTVKIVSSAVQAPEARGPSSILSEYLQNSDLLVTRDSFPDFLVSINHNPHLYRDFINQGGHPHQMALIRLEPESVFPLQYKQAILDGYGLVITPGSTQDFLDPKKFVAWPYQYNLNPNNPNISDPSLDSILSNPSWQDLFTYENWKSRPRKLVMVAANKVSPTKNANYSIRRKLAKEMSPQDLEVYGPLWDGKLGDKVYHRLAVTGVNLRQGIVPHPISIYGNLLTRYSTARGPVDNKHAILKQARFSLVVENSNHYVSEKIIDSMINGSIPLYVGPKLEEVGLPNAIAIRSSGKREEILEIMRRFDSKSISPILDEMKRFFGESTFLETWTGTSTYKKLSRQLTDYFLGLSEGD